MFVIEEVIKSIILTTQYTVQLLIEYITLLWKNKTDISWRKIPALPTLIRMTYFLTCGYNLFLHLLVM